MAVPIALHEMILGHPVTLPAKQEGILFDPVKAVLPHVQAGLFLLVQVVPVGEPKNFVQELSLDVQRRHLPTIGQPDLPPASRVVADLTDGPDRILQGHIAEDNLRLFQHPEE